MFENIEWEETNLIKYTSINFNYKNICENYMTTKFKKKKTNQKINKIPYKITVIVFMTYIFVAFFDLVNLKLVPGDIVSETFQKVLYFKDSLKVS